MLAIPVVEVRAGRCVHTHLDASRKKTIVDDPYEIVALLADQGARQIQIVDVDAIRNRQPEHLSLLSHLKKRFEQIQFQITGGVTSSEDIQIWLDAGADWITVGGRLLRKEEELELILVENGKNIIIGLDVKASIWSKGYSPVQHMTFAEWAEALFEEDVAALMFTEIPETGHVNGHNLLSASELAEQIKIPVIAHGGICSMADLKNLLQPNYKKLYGVTVSKPIFSGDFEYGEAVAMLQ